MKMNDDAANIIETFLNSGNYYIMPKPLVRAIGHHETMLLMNLISRRDQFRGMDKLDRQGRFYFTQERIEQDTSLSEHQQRKALRKLESLGILETSREGIPPTYYYKINSSAIFQCLNNLSNNAKEIKATNLEKLEHNNKNIVNKNKGTFSPSKPLVLSTEKKIPMLLRRSHQSPISISKPISPNIINIISYWNNSPGLTTHQIPTRNKDGTYQKGTRTFETLVKQLHKLLEGRLLSRAYTKEEVIHSIDNFKLAATNLDYRPVNKDTLCHVTLSNFLHNPWASTPGGRDLFLKYLEGPPETIKTTVPRQKELDPQLTLCLKEMYIERVESREFTPTEENRFIRGANLLSHSIDRMDGRLLTQDGDEVSSDECCEWVFRAWDKRFPTQSMSLGNISSEWIYNELLPEYLSRIGRLLDYIPVEIVERD